MHNFSLTTKCGMDCSLYVYEGQIEIQMRNCVKQSFVALHCIHIKTVYLHGTRFEKRRKTRKKQHTKWARVVWIILPNATEQNRMGQNRIEWNIGLRNSALTVINNNRKKLFSLFNTHSADRMKIACHTICSLYSVFTFYSHLRFFIAFGFSDTSLVGIFSLFPHEECTRSG